MSKEERAIKIKILEEVEADLQREHATYKEAYDNLKSPPVFWRDADDILLEGMGGCIRAMRSVHKILYPLYHEIQQEEKKP